MFSPTACVLSRQFSGVTVDRSFDVWSLGMAILHLYLGRGYFEGMSDPQVNGTAVIVASSVMQVGTRG